MRPGKQNDTRTDPGHYVFSTLAFVTLNVVNAKQATGSSQRTPDIQNAPHDHLQTSCRHATFYSFWWRVNRSLSGRPLCRISCLKRETCSKLQLYAVPTALFIVFDANFPTSSCLFRDSADETVVLHSLVTAGCRRVRSALRQQRRHAHAVAWCIIALRSTSDLTGKHTK